MGETSTLERAALGVAAGFAGTLAMQGLRSASDQFLPATMPPIQEDPGQFMVEQAEKRLPPETRERVPKGFETAAAMGLAIGYGLAAGALYGVLRPCGGSVLRDGTALGLGVWAAGYLGWLPALGLMSPVTEQQTPQVVGPVVRHALFGIATVAAYHWLQRRVAGE